MSKIEKTAYVIVITSIAILLMGMMVHSTRVRAQQESDARYHIAQTVTRHYSNSLK